MTTDSEFVKAPATMVAAPSRFAMPILPALSLAVMVSLVVVALFAPLLAPHSERHGQLQYSLEPPVFDGGTIRFPLGTDIHGRDQLSRVIYGARISVSVVLVILVFKTLIGVGLGLVAGFFGGILDSLIMSTVDILIAFPAFLLAILMAVIFGPSFLNVILIITLFIWPPTARQVRVEVLALKQQDFVTLARCAGSSNTRIMIKHILPGVIPTVLVITTLQVGTVILFEAALSFLGVGIPPPAPSWGGMVSEGRAQLTSAPWLSIVPGFAIFATVLATNTLGDWLRDRLDPRLQTL
ncbi:MAG: ABC transporter permease [Chloroflexi bacterium]|nr:ABC transporter permease [Chloroflexota bacterium]